MYINVCFGINIIIIHDTIENYCDTFCCMCFPLIFHLTWKTSCSSS